jgi:hypothetical protein
LSQVTKAQLLPALVDLGGGALIVVAEQLAEASLWANRMYRSFADVGNLGLSNLNKKVVEQQSGLDKMIETQKAAEKHFSDRTRNPDTDDFLRSRIESRRKRILERKAEIEETKKNIKEKIKARKEEMALLRGGDAPVNISR